MKTAKWILKRGRQESTIGSTLCSNISKVPASWSSFGLSLCILKGYRLKWSVCDSSSEVIWDLIWSTGVTWVGGWGWKLTTPKSSHWPPVTPPPLALSSDAPVQRQAAGDVTWWPAQPHPVTTDITVTQLETSRAAKTEYYKSHEALGLQYKPARALWGRRSSKYTPRPQVSFVAPSCMLSKAKALAHAAGICCRTRWNREESTNERIDPPYFAWCFIILHIVQLLSKDTLAG